ncbi:FAD-binding oxidoreductase [Streptomyces sp. NBC_01187]|uniref:FAD-binding oxidoreductase n=1 Tax=Streptomyces sp. NBC_01187 TaxID=2903766 RepID=UPI003870C730|nr:FAD-binding protein [Streptomyces sp. NBC_01187]
MPPPQEYGLTVPAGTVSSTGVAGLTLGGGIGHLMRRFGATVDNLLACEMVTVDGRKVRADEAENPELFWALRGGGGNFGVVTAFEYRAHPVGPEVVAGQLIFPFGQAADVLAELPGVMAAAPRELGLLAAIAPPPRCRCCPKRPMAGRCWCSSRSARVSPPRPPRSSRRSPRWAGRWPTSPCRHRNGTGGSARGPRLGVHRPVQEAAVAHPPSPEQATTIPDSTTRSSWPQRPRSSPARFADSRSSSGDATGRGGRGSVGHQDKPRPAGRAPQLCGKGPRKAAQRRAGTVLVIMWLSRP